jgi:glutamate-1-semialdehyde 2,1-aminomutase
MIVPKETPARIRHTYLERTPQSAQAFTAMQHVVPGGNSRQAGFWAPYPLTITRGQGAHIWDLDGNRYIDCLNNYSALVHGHAYGPILAAVQAQIPLGTCWAANCTAQAELAGLLVDRVASIDQVRFTNSGTEAGALAMMIARTVTGRRKILMARYGYHGALMEFEVGYTGKGGPDTCLATYGDADDFRRVLAAQGDDIAAVFLEPVLGAGGVVAGCQAFIQAVCTAAREAGALFVMDEVLSFRLGVGGRQQVLSINPDLTMFGKLIGGGFPVGGVGGSREVMRMFDPADLKAFHTGTFNANPVTMTAGVVSVRELDSDRIDRMERLALRFKAGLIDAAGAAGLPLTVNHVGSLLNMFFTQEPVATVQQRPDTELITQFHLAALNHGLFLASRGLMALSTVMDEHIIDEAIEHAAAAMADMNASH